MSNKLDEELEDALRRVKDYEMSEEEAEAQRQSFAKGNVELARESQMRKEGKEQQLCSKYDKAYQEAGYKKVVKNGSVVFLGSPADLKKKEYQPCPDCGDSTRSNCDTCDGCGEVVYCDAAEIREMDRKLQEAGLPSDAAAWELNEDQAQRFIDIAIKPNVMLKKMKIYCVSCGRRSRWSWFHRKVSCGLFRLFKSGR